MVRRLKLKAVAQFAATLALLPTACAAATSVAFADVAGIAPGIPACTTVIVKVPARHWVRVKLTRKVHGHRVVVRRHGKIVHIRAYVRYLKTEVRQTCPPAPIAPVSPIAPAAVVVAAPAVVAPAAVGSPPVTEVPPVSPEAPADTAPPTVSGSPKSGEIVTASPGTWSGSPTGYTYQWNRCDSSGANCAAIAGATSQSYTLGELDGTRTVRVAVTASNAAGASTPVSSAQTAVVTRAFSSAFGKIGVGDTSDRYGADRKRVSGYTLPAAGLVSRLNIYLQPSGAEGQQVLEGVLYQDAAGKPGALLGVSGELVFHSGEPGAWHALAFPQPLDLPAGKYWIGVITGASANVASFRFDNVAGSRYANADAYSDGPSSAFGTPEIDSEQMSIYATYASKSPLSAPVNSAAPTLSGVAQTEQKLTAASGSWSESPSSYSYQWQRCDSNGANCAAIPGASGTTYKLGVPDLGSRLKVSVVASNGVAPSTPASSGPSPAVTSSAGIHRIEYVLNVGLVSAYDVDHGWKSVGTISLPQAVTGVRGVSVSPNTHVMFVSYGGDGAGYGPGSVLAYDLLSDEVLWTTNLSTGIDSGQVSQDGQLLYMPTGEASSGTIWNVLGAADGGLVKTISGGPAPHNTVATPDGRYVYLGGRYSEYLYRYDTVTGKVAEPRIGPLTPGVRPFTVNSSNKLAFTTATEFDGFQVSNIETGKVLFTISFGAVPLSLPDSAPSHGISLSPDEKELYVVDDVNKVVQVYDVSKVSEGVEPKPLAAIPVTGLGGIESPCAYDCGRGGWLQRSTDGQFVLVADSGDVIETATKKVVANLPTLLNTKISVEIDWKDGVPTATSGRTGVGGVG
jgi:hypothetical protein